MTRSESGPLQIGFPFLEQTLVAKKALELRLLHRLGCAHRDVTLYRLQQRRELLQQRREAEVEEDVLVLGVVRDVGDLVREQPRIDRVDHRPGAGDRVVDLKMPVAVPGEGRDPLPGLHAEALQRAGELPRPRMWGAGREGLQ